MRNLSQTLAIALATPTAVATQTFTSTIVEYHDNKGNAHNLTAEGALFKGGKALAALKDRGLESALIKASNGKYRAASEVLAAAYPSSYKAVDRIVGTPWANKSSMATLINACRREDAERKEAAKKDSARHDSALDLIRHLCQLPAFADAVAPTKLIAGETDTPDTITVENGAQ